MVGPVLTKGWVKYEQNQEFFFKGMHLWMSADLFCLMWYYLICVDCVEDHTALQLNCDLVLHFNVIHSTCGTNVAVSK